MAEAHGSTAVSAGSMRGNGNGDGRALLEVEGLTSAYGPVRALDGVSLSAEAGRITAVLGANGAGKTTLLRTISGLVRPVSGTVRLDGEDITRAAVEAMVGKGMSHVPEGRGVIAELTVDENLRVGSLFRGKVGRDEFDKVYETFPRIYERKDNPAHTLSGGERQMLVIGRALMAAPRMLLLDEPSLGLAPRVVEQIRDLIVTINAAGTTVLLVEQNATMALSIATHGYILETGKVVMDKPSKELLEDEDVREFYLGLAKEGTAKSFRDVKHYKRRKRWLS
jgi:branched-chain amino acid transport system ATP-binding protein